MNTLQKAVNLITSDAESSRRHWTQILEREKASAAAIDPADGSRGARMERRSTARWICVATAALKQIDETGVAPSDLTLGGAAACLGIDLKEIGQ